MWDLSLSQNWRRKGGEMGNEDGTDPSSFSLLEKRKGNSTERN